MRRRRDDPNPARRLMKVSTMPKPLVYLTLASAALLAFAILLSSVGISTAGKTLFYSVRLPLDTVAFAAGGCAGLGSVWMALVPWSRVPDLALRILVTWRRNLVLATLAAACTGVLLFY